MQAAAAIWAAWRERLCWVVSADVVVAGAEEEEGLLLEDMVAFGLMVGLWCIVWFIRN